MYGSLKWRAVFLRVACGEDAIFVIISRLRKCRSCAARARRASVLLLNEDRAPAAVVDDGVLRTRQCQFNASYNLARSAGAASEVTSRNQYITVHKRHATRSWSYITDSFMTLLMDLYPLLCVLSDLRIYISDDNI